MGHYTGIICFLEEISSDRRNPILADVMAQLDYMEKRGSGLKRICNETKALDGYKEELKPVFKSTTSQFMTTIYSMEYESKDQQSQQNEQSQAGNKLGLSWEQVGTKTGLSWNEVAKLFIALQEPKSMTELKELYRWSNTTKFKAKYVSPLIEAQFVAMTLPNKPTSPNQKYYLTDSGKTLLTNEMKGAENKENVNEKVRHMVLTLNDDEKRIAMELLKGNHFSD